MSLVSNKEPQYPAAVCVWSSAYENGCESNLILHRISEVAGNYHTAVIISVHVPQGFWHILRNMDKKPECLLNVSVHLISFIHIQVAMFVEACYQLCFKSVFLILGMVVLFKMWLCCFSSWIWLLVVKACFCCSWHSRHLYFWILKCCFYILLIKIASCGI